MAPLFERIWKKMSHYAPFFQQPDSYSTISENGSPEFGFFLTGFKPTSHFLDYSNY